MTWTVPGQQERDADERQRLARSTIAASSRNHGGYVFASMSVARCNSWMRLPSGRGVTRSKPESLNRCRYSCMCRQIAMSRPTVIFARRCAPKTHTATVGFAIGPSLGTQRVPSRWRRDSVAHCRQFAYLVCRRARPRGRDLRHTPAGAGILLPQAEAPACRVEAVLRRGLAGLLRSPGGARDAPSARQCRPRIEAIHRARHRWP